MPTHGPLSGCCTTWISSSTPRCRPPALSRQLRRMHPFVGVAHLRQQGWSDEVCRAILAHADYSGVRPESAMEKTLVAVDELSSFVIAVALVRPSKSIFEV